MSSLLQPYITDTHQLQLLEQSMTGKLKYSLMNDFLSKYSFQNDRFALAGLLAALLNIDVNTITNIDILNPIEPADVITDKDCILDIKLELNHKKLINLEIQSRFQEFWPERSLTYLCRIFNNLEEGASYSDVRPCIQVGILAYDLFKQDDYRHTGKFYSEYRLKEVSTGQEYTGKFQIRVLSLKHLEEADEKDKKDQNGLYKGAKLLTAKTWEELKMIAEENPRTKSFVGTVRQLSAEEKVAQACERRRLHNLDMSTLESEIKKANAKVAAVNAENESLKARYESATSEIEQLKAKIKEMEKNGL